MSDVSEEQDRYTLPIEFVVPESLKSRYAMNVIVQHDKHEFYISFFEVAPPILVGTTEERLAQIGKITSIRSECVARIIVSPERMGDFIGAMQTNYAKYQAKQEGQDD